MDSKKQDKKLDDILSAIKLVYGCLENQFDTDLFLEKIRTKKYCEKESNGPNHSA